MNATYAEVQIPIYINPFRVMGKGGDKLFRITDESKCQYIWVDIRRRVVEIWGRDESLPHAIALVRRHIHRLVSRAIQVPDEYYNLSNDIRDRMTVYSWRSGCMINYEMIGPDKDTTNFFDVLLESYPYNPFMTKIDRKTAGGLLASRHINI